MVIPKIATSREDLRSWVWELGTVPLFYMANFKRTVQKSEGRSVLG